jgi:hypothetical protein
MAALFDGQALRERGRSLLGVGCSADHGTWMKTAATVVGRFITLEDSGGCIW